jgi:AFG3 family protein
MAKPNLPSNPKLPVFGKPRINIWWIYLGIIFLFFGLRYLGEGSSAKELAWNQIKIQALEPGYIDRLVVVNGERVEIFLNEDGLKTSDFKELAEGRFGTVNPGPHLYFTIGSVEYFQTQLDLAQEDIELAQKISPSFETRVNWLSNMLSWLLPVALIIVFWLFIMKRMRGGSGGGGMPFMDVNKAKPRLFDGSEKVDVTFDDVAGLDEAREEVMEIVDFLKRPEKYKALGAKIPKGVLLTGPPGTGKTLLARAMAGESGVPFFTISGSDFVEMFVGVGAARVRDLFKKAREKAPCIIFIDEIEAIGRSRSRSNSQTNDERENTLNQLLVEMDGFSSEHTVIILAATNRPDLLDSALVRPGRFDRQIHIDKPDLAGREEIFKVHLKKLTLDTDVDAKRLAELTPGFAGAEIANSCNEAALFAARKKALKVNMDHFMAAIDRMVGGLEKKNKRISPEEKVIIAYHEAGHALLGAVLPHAHPLVKVSIVPRGMAALGITQFLPKEKNLYSYEELLDTLCMTLGGRVAEEIQFGDVTTGAQNDLERCTELVYAMIGRYGMDPEIGLFSFKGMEADMAFRNPFSEATSAKIDERARALMSDCHGRANELIQKNKGALDALAKALLEKETLNKEDIEAIIAAHVVG